MRLRPLALLSTLAVSALLLAGCAGSASPSPTSTADSSSDGDVCAQTAKPGAVSDGVKIEGEFGKPSSATFALKPDIDKLQRTVVTKGDGATLKKGEYVSYALSAFDPTTGERLGDAGYPGTEMLPQNVLANPTLAQAIGCTTVGSRLALAFPAAGSGSQPLIYIVDVLGTVRTAAWGEQQEPVDGMPTVKLAKNGEPSITIPKADPPSELKVSVLKQGDGDVVADGDTTLLQYFGVNWSDGKSFDSSWKNGEPISIPGNTYVPGFVQAMAGQKVGSQVLVVIPPALGYGDKEQSSIPANSTLVFVIDILATQHAPAAQ